MPLAPAPPSRAVASKDFSQNNCEALVGRFHFSLSHWLCGDKQVTGPKMSLKRKQLTHQRVKLMHFFNIFFSFVMGLGEEGKGVFSRKRIYIQGTPGTGYGWAVQGTWVTPASASEPGGAHWETFPLPRKARFLPVTQPWPGNLRRTARDCLLSGPTQGTHWLGRPGQRFSPRSWPGLEFGCLGGGSQRRCRLRLGWGGWAVGSCPPEISQSLLPSHRSKINYYVFFCQLLFPSPHSFLCFSPTPFLCPDKAVLSALRPPNCP